MRTDVIVNTTARHFRTRGAGGRDLLGRVLELCVGRADLHPTHDLTELDQVAALLAERGSDLVVLAGGDGTYMAGVTALCRHFGEGHLPRLALVPGGTVATVARNWGAGPDAPRALARVLAAQGGRPAVRRPTLRVREIGGEQGPAERIGFIFGTGLVAKFFELYYADGARGTRGAARIVARIFAESFYGGAVARQVLDPLPCTIEVEGRRLGPEAWSLVCASVVPDLGIHMRVTYRAGEDLDRPHLVASPLPSRSLGPRAPLVLAGRRIGGEGHFDDLVRDFAVRFDRAGVGPYVLDGDMLRAPEVRVSAGPHIEVVS